MPSLHQHNREDDAQNENYAESLDESKLAPHGAAKYKQRLHPQQIAPCEQLSAPLPSHNNDLALNRHLRIDIIKRRGEERLRAVCRQ